MTFMNKLLAYLGFCPSKESAQDFRVRNNTITSKQKEYRNAIIGGSCAGVVNGIIYSIGRGEFSWTFLILSVIVYPIAILTGLKMREKRKGPVEGVKGGD